MTVNGNNGTLYSRTGDQNESWESLQLDVTNDGLFYRINVGPKMRNYGEVMKTIAFPEETEEYFIEIIQRWSGVDD